MNPWEYRIIHLCLNESLAAPSPDGSNQGTYVVIWWESIPLGEFFIEPHEHLTQEQYYSNLKTAITPAITFYASNQQEINWPSLLQAQDMAGFAAFMGSLLSDRTTKKIPATVPVTVIICTRNRAASVTLCLESIGKMACQPAEIIIVENARENDATSKAVASFPNVTYYEEPSPGLSYARNTGVQKAGNSIIAFTDDDVIVHPEWVFRIWESFTHKKVAAMTGLVLTAELETETQMIFEKCWSFNRGYVDILYDEAYFDKTLSSGPPVWEIGAGANMAFRKEIFREAGLFDVRLGAGSSGCNEDSEMWYRILLHRQHIVYNPRAVVYHAHRRDISSLKKQIFSYMRGFVTAALLQQQQYQRANYKKRLYKELPKFYFLLVKRGFPRYRFRNRTIWVEIKGMLSGYLLYRKHQKAVQKTN